MDPIGSPTGRFANHPDPDQRKIYSKLMTLQRTLVIPARQGRWMKLAPPDTIIGKVPPEGTIETIHPASAAVSAGRVMVVFAAFAVTRKSFPPSVAAIAKFVACTMKLVGK